MAGRFFNFVPMQFEDIKNYILSTQQRGKKMFVTSSFQSHSLPLLHMISRIDNTIPVYFINTGFHFPETLEFRDKIISDFGLKKMINLYSMVPRNLQKNDGGNFYFTSDPDQCCFINKTQPMEVVLAEYDVWINGIRGDQNANRRNMQVEQPAPFNTIRFHPMLDWTSKMIYEYSKEFNLPRHPLEENGYLSIGCEPCTRKLDLMNDRGGRWYGMHKSECGLHTDLVK